jgi:hypothetical protein
MASEADTEVEEQRSDHTGTGTAGTIFGERNDEGAPYRPVAEVELEPVERKLRLAPRGACFSPRSTSATGFYGGADAPNEAPRPEKVLKTDRQPWRWAGR